MTEITGAVQSRRYDGVQVLRFVAALLVVILHSAFYASERLDPATPQWPPGTSGVDIFFVISGFVMVVSSRQLERLDNGWAYFGIRRLIRVMPMYWIATTVKVLVMLVLPGAVLHAVLTPQTVASGYLLIPERSADGGVAPLLAVGWTLYFEMFFYLLYTIALLVNARPIWFAGPVLLACFVVSFFRTDDWPPITIYASHIVIYFLIGMVIAELITIPSRALRRWLWGALAVLAIVSTVGLVTGQRFTFKGSSVWGIVIVATIVLAVVLFEPKFHGRVPKWALLLGDASYSLYLFHPLVAPIVPEALARLGWRISWLSVLGSVALAVLASVVVYRLIERPLLRVLHDRVPFGRVPRKAAPIAPASGDTVREAAG